MTLAEGIGYLASALIVLSLAMRSVVRLRTISLVGSIVFVVYGLMISAWPVAVSNAIIACLNVYYLVREFRPRRPIAAVEMRADSAFLADFLDANAATIARTQPEWKPSPADTFVRLLTREGLPAGVLIGEPTGPELLVKLDYVTPRYRDSLVARWLFGEGRHVFTDAGFTRLLAQATTSEHRGYLEMVGFRLENGHYVLDLG